MKLTSDWSTDLRLASDWPSVPRRVGFQFNCSVNIISSSPGSRLDHNGTKTPIWFFCPAPIPIPPVPASLKRQLFHQTVLVTSSISTRPPPSPDTCLTWRDRNLQTQDIVIVPTLRSPGFCVGSQTQVSSLLMMETELVTIRRN